MASYKAQREGDPNTAGGIAIGGAVSVLINGRPAGVNNMTVTPHPSCPTIPSHCSAKTVSTCQSVLIEGLKALRTDVDKDTCAHPRAMGSVDVLIGE